MKKKTKKQSKHRHEVAMERIQQHLSEMRESNQDVDKALKELIEHFPNILDFSDRLDITNAGNGNERDWEHFDRSDAHEWLGGAFAHVEFLKRFSRQANSIAHQAQETFKHAQLATELTESTLLHLGITARTEVA